MREPTSLLLRTLLILVVIAPHLALANTQRLPALPLQQTRDLPAATTEHAVPEGTCGNRRFVKSLAVTRVWLPSPPADVLNLGTALSEAITRRLDRQGPFRTILVPATRARDLAPAIGTFTQLDQPYFIRIVGHDFMPTGKDSRWSFLGPSADPRGGTIDITIDNGAKGSGVTHTELGARPVAITPYQPPIDARGAPFWDSAYGQSLQQLATQAAAFITQSLGCAPLLGEVVRVEGTQVTVNRGADDGLRLSDHPRLLSRSDPISVLGQETRPERHLLVSLGTTDVIHLGHRTARLRYTGPQRVQVGDLVQVGE